jgi:hypothetical protein
MRRQCFGFFPFLSLLVCCVCGSRMKSGQRDVAALRALGTIVCGLCRSRCGLWADASVLCVPKEEMSVRGNRAVVGGGDPARPLARARPLTGFLTRSVAAPARHPNHPPPPARARFGAPCGRRRDLRERESLREQKVEFTQGEKENKKGKRRARRGHPAACPLAGSKALPLSRRRRPPPAPPPSRLLSLDKQSETKPSWRKSSQATPSPPLSAPSLSPRSQSCALLPRSTRRFHSKN